MGWFFMWVGQGGGSFSTTLWQSEFKLHDSIREGAGGREKNKEKKKPKPKTSSLETRKHFTLEKFLELLIMAEDLQLDFVWAGIREAEAAKWASVRKGYV